MWVVGGFLSLVTRLTNFCLKGYQSFVIDKSMLKKVFSKKKDKGKQTDETQEPPESPREQNRLKVKETIMQREVFRYTWSARFCKSFTDTFCCARCIRNKTAKDKRAWLFASGLSKLYTEIDLLEVVK